MKKLIVVLIICFVLVGCSGNPGSIPPNNKTGVIILSYSKPIDFKQFEVYISTVAEFNPTGWDGSAWTGQPNAPAAWDGTANTLFMVTQNDPIQVTGLTPGVTYYYKVVVIDKTNQRSIPSPERSAVAGDAQRNSTLVVAASDASPASKAGADYVCDGVSDQETINEAITSLTAGRIILTEGTFIVDNAITIGSDIKIQGQGMSTIIKFKDGINDDMSMIRNSNFYDPDQIPNNNIEVSDLKLDGNAVNNSSGVQNGLYFKYVTNITIVNVTVEKFRDYGSLYAYCSNGAIKNNSMARECGAYGLYIYYSNYFTVSSFIAENNTGHGVCFAYSPSCVFTQSVSKANDRGIWITRSVNAIVSNNQVLLNSRDGIYLDYSDDALVSNNQVSQNSQRTNNLSSNIVIHTNSYRANLQNNVCRKGSLTNKPYSGINIGNAFDTLVVNNDCTTGGETHGIWNVGTGTGFGAGNRNNNGVWSTTPN